MHSSFRSLSLNLSFRVYWGSWLCIPSAVLVVLLIIIACLNLKAVFHRLHSCDEGDQHQPGVGALYANAGCNGYLQCSLTGTISFLYKGYYLVTNYGGYDQVAAKAL